MTTASVFTSSLTNENIVSLVNPRRRIIVQESAADWREAVMTRFEQLCSLPVGWDGYNGVPVSFTNANFAVRMLEAVCAKDAPAPQIVPGPRGDLQVEWHTAAADIELHVRGANDVHAWRLAVGSSDDDAEQFDLTNDFTVVTNWINDLAEQSRGAVAAAA